MATRTKKFTKAQAVLFAELAHGPARLRKHGTLFIQRYVDDAAQDLVYAGSDQDNAYAILSKWADLETQGHLPTYSETSVDLTFLNQVFGEALGYVTKTANPQRYELDAKWNIPGGGGQPDGVLGRFPEQSSPEAVIELKGADFNLDRDKPTTTRRTAVDQCFDYLIALPDCPWGIVCNFQTFRLYHRSRTKRNYEEFTLQELRKRETFNKFYLLFHKGAMLGRIGQRDTLLLQLLKQTDEQRRTVGDQFFKEYRYRRNELIHYLNKELAKPLDVAIKWAQRLLDRVIFIAFCENRGLLPAKTLKKVTEQSAYTRATNPQWQSLLALFQHVDKGHPSIDLDIGYNGGLFKPEPGLDDLQLPDKPWVQAFTGFGDYDFREGGDVNVDVLGHIFEKSITELEKLRPGGLLAIESADAAESPTPKSAERKKFGIYYTPPAFTGLFVEKTVDELVRDRFEALARKFKVDPDSGKSKSGQPSAEYWSAALDMLKDLKICDPACGSGAFLIRAYDAMQHHYGFVIDGLIAASQFKNGTKGQLLEQSIPDFILSHNLHGVDVSEQAVEITQLALWIRSARPNRKLTDISENIVCRNSLVSDKSIHERAIDWEETFPQVFGRKGDRKGFDCVIGNPPWERVKIEERQFFAMSAPQIAFAPNPPERNKLIERLQTDNSELWNGYKAAQSDASRMLAYVRSNAAGFPLTGKGDVDLYMLFAELARKIVAPLGRVGLLLPSGIATGHTAKEFFGELVATKTLQAIYDFVNRLGIFPDVEGRQKFCILLFVGSGSQIEDMDFVFWAERIENLAVKSQHVVLSANDIKLMNPNTLTCPIFRTQRDADLTRGIYRRVRILVDEHRKRDVNPWGIKFLRMFDQTNDAGLFAEGKTLQEQGFKFRGNLYVKSKKRWLPLLEAKMTRDYDHRATWVTMDRTKPYMSYSAEAVSLVQHQNPEFLPMGRYWVADDDVATRAPKSLSVAAIGFHDVARANDTRTMVACLVPYAAYSNTLPLILNDNSVHWRRFCCLMGNLGSYAYDFVLRQKVGAAHLNFFIIEQIPTLPPETYSEKCEWSKRETLEHWISDRVLKLTCTAEDMKPLAEACNFKGSRGDGVHIWKEQERAQLRAELDATFFYLYGINRDDVDYILSTFTNTGRREEPDLGKNESQWIEGGTGDLILAAFDTLSRS